MGKRKRRVRHAEYERNKAAALLKDARERERARLVRHYPSRDIVWDADTDRWAVRDPTLTPGTLCAIGTSIRCPACGHVALNVRSPGHVVIRCEHCGYHRVSEMRSVPAPSAPSGPSVTEV